MHCKLLQTMLQLVGLLINIGSYYGVFPISQNSEIYIGDWFWLGGIGVHVRGGREQKK